MDKIISTRMDEAVIRRVALLAKRRGTSKKAVIERAVLSYAEKIEAEDGWDVLDQTLGCWNRDESAEEIVWRIRK